MIDTEMFAKKVCRLCETHEHHTTGLNADKGNCTYWLDDGRGSMAPHIRGFVSHDGVAHEFFIPAIKCPWCGKELLHG